MFEQFDIEAGKVDTYLYNAVQNNYYSTFNI